MTLLKNISKNYEKSKSYVKENIKTYNKDLEILLARRTYQFHFLMMFVYGFIWGTSIRIIYNGLYDTFVTNAFKLSLLGLAWGKTPFNIQLISLLFVVISALFYAKYIIYIKNKHFYSGVTWANN